MPTPMQTACVATRVAIALSSAALVSFLVALGCTPPPVQGSCGEHSTGGGDGSACVCETGFEDTGAGCVDVNECGHDNGGCAAGATCTNTVGSFVCACSPGTSGNGVHCASSAACGGAACDPHATCRNGTTCVCDEGYRGTGASCVDVDECTCGTAGEDGLGCALESLTGKRACGDHRACMNSAGGFTCGACEPGYSLVSGTCQMSVPCGGVVCGAHASCNNATAPSAGTCTCEAGYAGAGVAAGGACAAIDDCNGLPSVCDAHATCASTGPGTHMCTCASGFSGDGRTCSDIDECATNNGGCGGGDTNAATCTNTPGGFSCVCNPGYGGATCADVDECAVPCAGGDTHCNSCSGPHQSVCHDTIGSHTCDCDPGYQSNGSGGCTAVPSCGSYTCGANATCSDIVSPTSGHCECRQGYAGSLVAEGGDCVDVDECLTSNGNCAGNATCANTDGSHTCSCAVGFTGSHADYPDTVCTDIDECLASNGGCDAHAFCVNTTGGHTCTCGNGYTPTNGTKPDTVCTDVNECLTNDGNCAANSVCGNTGGTHTCTCGAAYEPTHGTNPDTTCTPINRCLNATNNCAASHATCSYTGPGTFSCGCETGYTGDGVSGGTGCTDVDECLVNSGGCAGNTICTNAPGTFSCEPRIIVVNDTGDTTADDGKCTLREAVVAANTDTASGATVGECVAGFGADSITVPSGTFAFAATTLTISTTMTFSGAGAGVTLLSGSVGISVTAGTATFQNASVSAASMTTSSGATVAFSATGGATSTLTLTGALTNGGAITAGKLTISAGSMTNSVGSSLSSTGDLSVTATGQFSNASSVDAGGDLTINAATLRNETSVGDTREWYRSFTGSDTNDSTDSYYDFPDDYEVQYWSKTWVQSQRYVGGPPAVRPQLTAVGVLTLQGFNVGTNVGALISAPTVTLAGNGGATFTNNTLALNQQNWRQGWEIYTHWIALGPLMYDDHIRRNDDGGVQQSTSEISNIGAGVVATTLNAGGFTL